MTPNKTAEMKALERDIRTFLADAESVEPDELVDEMVADSDYVPDDRTDEVAAEMKERINYTDAVALDSEQVDL